LRPFPLGWFAVGLLGVFCADDEEGEAGGGACGGAAVLVLAGVWAGCGAPADLELGFLLVVDVGEEGGVRAASRVSRGSVAGAPYCVPRGIPKVCR
jgi:hypothetical protein